MSAPTVPAGGHAPLVFTFADDLDTGTESLEIATSGAVVVVGPTATGVAGTGSGRYAYVWSTSTSTTADQYTATLSGEISSVAVSETVVVTVTAGYAYVSLADLKDELGLTGTASDDRLRRALQGSSRAIENACNGRRFWRDGSTSARQYTVGDRAATLKGHTGGMLLVDDIATETGLMVEIGGSGSWSTVASTSVLAYPDNAIARGKAIQALVYDGGTFAGARRARITADWGWPAVPTEVETACMLQAMRLSRRHLSPEGVTGSTEFGGPMRIPRLDPDVQALIAHLALPALG